MTWKDFVCLKWQFASHLAMADYHYTTSTAEANGHTFAFCSRVPTEEYKAEHRHARCCEHYKVDGVLYNTRKALEIALAKI